MGSNHNNARYFFFNKTVHSLILKRLGTLFGMLIFLPFSFLGHVVLLLSHGLTVQLHNVRCAQYSLLL